MSDELVQLMGDVLGCEHRYRYFDVSLPFCKVHGGHVWPCLEAQTAASRVESSGWFREVPTRIARGIWEDEQKCTEALVKNPTDPHLNGRLMGLTRARDIAEEAGRG